MALDDTGHRADFGTGAMRERAPGKGRYDLIPPEALIALAKVFEEGARKYSDRNWERGIPIATCIDSGMRHLVKLMDGDDSEDHAALCMSNMAMFIALRERGMGEPFKPVVQVEHIHTAEREHPIANVVIGDGLKPGWVSDMYRCAPDDDGSVTDMGSVGNKPHAAHTYGRHGGMWCDGYV